MINAPGVYTIPAAEYHADPCPEPSLNFSTAKAICLESPRHAWEQHPRLNPHYERTEADHFDLGTAVHQVLLEGTHSVQLVEAKDWRTKDAKEQRDAAREAGKLPLLTHVWADVQAMVTAAREQLGEHRDASAMFTVGTPEQTIVWLQQDAWCRARVDWLRPSGARIYIDDYKTATDANPDEWTGRAFWNHGYDLQAEWYRQGVATVHGVPLDQVRFTFAVQETRPPYALVVVALGGGPEVIGQKKWRYALERWTACRRDDRWPSYASRTCYADVPRWHEDWWLEKEQRP